MSERILIIEDDADIAESLRYNLERSGFKTDVAMTGEEGLRLALGYQTPPSLILLDLMLPGMSGRELCRRLHSERSTEKVPIVIVSAKAANADRVAGLELGADDYITKPFSIKELIARIHAILRRISDVPKKYNDGDLVVDFEDMRVQCSGLPVDLTKKEFFLLQTLIRNINQVATREKLLDEVWGYDHFGDGRTLDVHIRRLRQKLGDCSSCIETVMGVGYRFVGVKRRDH